MSNVLSHLSHSHVGGLFFKNHHLLFFCSVKMLSLSNLGNTKTHDCVTSEQLFIPLHAIMHGYAKRLPLK